jgi:hypothetical protein
MNSPDCESSVVRVVQVNGVLKKTIWKKLLQNVSFLYLGRGRAIQ